MHKIQNFNKKFDYFNDGEEEDEDDVDLMQDKVDRIKPNDIKCILSIPARSGPYTVKVLQETEKYTKPARPSHFGLSYFTYYGNQTAMTTFNLYMIRIRNNGSTDKQINIKFMYENKEYKIKKHVAIGTPYFYG